MKEGEGLPVSRGEHDDVGVEGAAVGKGDRAAAHLGRRAVREYRLVDVTTRRVDVPGNVSK